MRNMRWPLAALTAAALASACTIQVNSRQPSPTTPTTPTAEVVLTGQGAGGSSFGTPVADVEPALRAMLGEPSDVIEGTGCPLDPTWTRSVRWQGLTVVFEGDTEQRTDETELTSWQLRPGGGLPSGVSLGEGLSSTATFGELTAQFPGSEVTEQLGWSVLELPIGVTYLGENATTPSVIHGGPLQWCE